MTNGLNSTVNGTVNGVTNGVNNTVNGVTNGVNNTVDGADQRRQQHRPAAWAAR